jgi:drug/metabolite transporter (DMT)-like permease
MPRSFSCRSFFGIFPVAGKIALQAFPALGIVTFRIVGAAILLSLIQSFYGPLKLERRGDYARLFFYALLGVFLNQTFYVSGLALTTATNTALLATMIPVFAVIISAVFGYERLTLVKFAGIFLAAAGVLYLIGPAKASFSSQTTQGDLLIVLNSFFYASYIAISKDTFARNGALKSVVWVMIFGGVLAAPLGAYSMADLYFPSIGINAWIALGFIIVFSTAGAYFLNGWAMARVDPSIVVVYIYLQPLIGAALAMTLLGEPWKPRVLGAALLIFAGVFLVTRRRKVLHVATE